MSTFTYSGTLYSKIEVRIKYNILIYYNILCRYAGVLVLEYSFNWTYNFSTKLEHYVTIQAQQFNSTPYYIQSKLINNILMIN